MNALDAASVPPDWLILEIERCNARLIIALSESNADNNAAYSCVERKARSAVSSTCAVLSCQCLRPLKIWPFAQLL